MTKKRRRPIHLHVMVSEAEQALIQERMAEAGIRNMGAYMRKMASLKLRTKDVFEKFLPAVHHEYMVVRLGQEEEK